MFENSAVVETKLLHLQPFINSHFHFLIVMESVTQTNYSMTGQCQDQGVFFPKVSSEKAATTAVRFGLCLVTLSC